MKNMNIHTWQNILFTVDDDRLYRVLSFTIIVNIHIHWYSYQFKIKINFEKI